MANRAGRTIAAVCGGVAALVLTLGGLADLGGGGAPRINADPSPTVAPSPTSPDDVCCDDTTQPQASKWDCKIGLNCGQIRPRRTSPAPAPPPPPPPQ